MVGKRRPPSKRCGHFSDWRRRGAGPGPQSCGRSRGCLRCIRWWRGCMQSTVRFRRDRLVAWLGKPKVTFSDAITAVAVGGVGFARPGHREAFQKLGGGMRRVLLNGLAPAA